MDKTELLKDSVKKLLSLGVLDEEIFSSLSEVGISKEDAQKLVNDVKNNVKNDQVSSEGVFEKTAKALRENIPLPNKVQDNLQKQGQVENINNNTFNQFEKKEINPLDVDFGVDIRDSSQNSSASAKNQVKKTELVDDIVNQSSAKGNKVAQAPSKNVENNSSKIADKLLSEISQVKGVSNEKNSDVKTQNEITQNLSSENGINEVEKKPVQKISEVQQSDIEELWKKGIVIAINAKLDDMRKMKDEIEMKIDSKVDLAVRNEINQFRVLLDSQKDLIISSNREALAEKQKEITFIIDSKIAELKKYNQEIEENMKLINQTKDSQEKAMREINESLETVKKTKTQLVMEMNSELIKSKSNTQEFIDKSDRHLKEMDDRINKTLEFEKNIADGMLAKVEQKIENLTINKANNIIDELQIELNKIKSIEKEVSIETLDEKIKTLEKFKSEFLNSMQENLKKINDAIEKLNDKNDNVEKELKGRMLIFDAKIEELTKFEKEFAKVMANYLKKE
jgi:hypothetical protein